MHTNLTAGLPGRISRILSLLASLSLIVMAVHIVLNAVLRTFLNDPIVGTNEYVSFWYMPILTFLGIYLAFRSNSHIDAPIIFDRLPSSVKRELLVVGIVLALLLFLGIGWFGLLEAIEATELKMTAGYSAIAMWPATYIVPFVSLLVVAECMKMLRPSSIDMVMSGDAVIEETVGTHADIGSSRKGNADRSVTGGAR